MAALDLNRVCIELNAEALRIVEDTGGNPVDALRRTAQAFGWGRVRCDDQSELWDKDGEVINLWIAGPMPGIREGGLGFDTQTEWAEDHR
jgi:hypothetical protein